MTNPYHWIPNSYLWMVFMGLVLVTVGVAYTISRQGKPLSTEKLPNGILEIEVSFPQIATIAAAIKFTLVFGAVGYLGIGGLRALIQLIKSA